MEDVDPMNEDDDVEVELGIAKMEGFLRATDATDQIKELMQQHPADFAAGFHMAHGLYEHTGKLQAACLGMLSILLNAGWTIAPPDSSPYDGEEVVWLVP